MDILRFVSSAEKTLTLLKHDVLVDVMSETRGPNSRASVRDGAVQRRRATIPLVSVHSEVVQVTQT